MIKPTQHIFDLDGRVAIVAGITGKFGPHFAQTLLDWGASHVAGFSLSGDTSKSEVLEELLRREYKISVHKVDVRDENAVAQGTKEVAERFGIPTILVNNAGIDVPPDSKPEDCGSFADYPYQTWQAIIDSHVNGTFLMSREVTRHLIRTGKKPASIINIGSTYGLVAPEHRIYSMRPGFVKPVAYSAAKGAIISMTRALAEQVAEYEIRVNCLVPGGVDHGHAKSFYEAYSEHTMLNRMGEYGDLQGAIIFLASEASGYMTGSLLIVDGGWTAK